MNRQSERFLKSLKEGLLGLVSDQDRERIADEAAAHLESIEARLVSEGVDRAVAAQQALLEFGSVEEIVDGYRPRSKSKRLDTAGKWTLALSFVMGAQYTVLLNVVRQDWNIGLAMTGVGRGLIYSILYAAPCGAIVTALFAKRFPLGRIALGIGAGMILTAVVAAKNFVPHPLGGPMLASEVRRDLFWDAKMGTSQVHYLKGGGKELVHGKVIHYYVQKGDRWESLGSSFLTKNARRGSMDEQYLTMSDDQLKAHGIVTTPMLEASLNVNGMQRFIAAFNWAGGFYSWVMAFYTTFQAAAWLLGAFVRLLYAWSQSNRVRPTVSL